MEKELFDMVAGKKLGEGVYREVFNFEYDEWSESGLVLKVAKGKEGREHNFVERRVWDEIVESDFAKWFAPVLLISKGGEYLIQKKVTMRPIDDFPEKIPTFFTDEKSDNYGFIDKRFVCFDYGSTVITKGFTKRKKKANWRC